MPVYQDEYNTGLVAEGGIAREVRRTRTSWTVLFPLTNPMGSTLRLSFLISYAALPLPGPLNLLVCSAPLPRTS